MNYSLILFHFLRYIIFWNIRSIIRKIDGVKDKIKESLPDVVAFSESWLKSNIPNSVIDIAGYNMHQCDRSFVNNRGHLKKGGGMLVYIRYDHLFDNITGDSFNISCNDIEVTTL